MNARKIGVLYQKDLKDFVKNPGILMAGLIPVLFVILYKYMGLVDQMMEEGVEGWIFILNIGTSMSLAMVALLIISSTIAEEKEKFTLRTLMLSNVTAGEFLLAKVLVTLTVTLVADSLIYVLSGAPLSSMAFYLLCCLLGSCPLIMCSACIGIVCRDQMSTSIYQIPVMLVVLLPSAFRGFSSFLTAVGDLTPISALMTLYFNFLAGDLAQWASLKALLAILVWTAVVSLLFVFLYRKKGMDN